MNNIVVGAAVVVILSGVYLFNKEEPKVINTQKHKKEQRMSREEIKKLNAKISFLQERFNSLSIEDKNNEEIKRLRDQLYTLKSNISEAASNPTKKIEGYSAVYDYTEKNNLKPMFDEEDQKKLKDGTPYNIYSDEEDDGYKEGITPPTTPVSSSININGEEIYIIVGSGTHQVAILSTPSNGVQSLVVKELTDTNSSDISPPVPPDVLDPNPPSKPSQPSQPETENSFTPPMAPTLGTGNTLPNVPNENLDDLVPSKN